ncbi:MAG: RIP metalloprotease RseP [Candidatus Acidiferrales bacterium]
MTSVLIAILSAAVVLGVVILVHEWGHFVAGRFFGVRVVIFSFGYGPRLWGWKRGDTDYRVSALPLGGYVRMAGDNPIEERSGAPDEFLSRPRWQRILIYLAGPTMNLVLAVVIFVGLFAVLGSPSPAYFARPVKIAAVPAHSAAEAAGIQAGDLIVKIGDINNPTWEKALVYLNRVTPGTQIPVVIERGGQRIPLTVTAQATDVEKMIGYPALPPIVGEVLAGLPAYQAGVQDKDQVLSVNGKEIPTWPMFVDAIKQSDGAVLHLVLLRDGQKINLDVQPIHGVNEAGQSVWQIGAGMFDPVVYQRMSLPAAAKQGFEYTLIGAEQVMDVVGELITGKVSVKQLQSVVGIARESGQAAKRGPVDFIEWLALISINLGILNLLPIPILDGGNIVMLAVEGALRRDISLAIKERIVQVGLVFLLVIFAIVMYNDVARTLPHH